MRFRLTVQFRNFSFVRSSFDPLRIYSLEVFRASTLCFIIVKSRLFIVRIKPPLTICKNFPRQNVRVLSRAKAHPRSEYSILQIFENSLSMVIYVMTVVGTTLRRDAIHTFSKRKILAEVFRQRFRIVRSGISSTIFPVYVDFHHSRKIHVKVGVQRRVGVLPIRFFKSRTPFARGHRPISPAFCHLALSLHQYYVPLYFSSPGERIFAQRYAHIAFFERSTRHTVPRTKRCSPRTHTHTHTTRRNMIRFRKNPAYFANNNPKISSACFENASYISATVEIVKRKRPET